MTVPRDATPGAPAPAVPIWAPNPGVPLLARVLAYLFAAMMLLAVVLTMTGARAIDPPVPPEWESYALGTNCTVPYPSAWVPIPPDTPLDKGMQEISFALVDRHNPIHYDVLLLPLSTTGDDSHDILDKLNAIQGERLAQQLHHFTQSDEVIHCTGGDAKTFTCTLNGALIDGAFLFLPRGQRTLGIIAFCPADGWPVMQDIFTHVANETKCADDPGTPAQP